MVIDRGLEAELCLFSFCLLREQEKSEMEQNETGCQAPQAPILCVNNCGFFGTAATMNMCSKCYKDLVLKQEQAKLAATSIQNIVNGGSTAGGKDSDVAVITEVHTTSLEILAVPTESSSSNSVSDRKEEVKGPKRCFTCRKRVGLTGFDCRCGNMFCAVHRYSDKHECPFDYRSAGQEAIAKANPIVKAEKLDKI
ncbi:Zinc finger A20 and AN1 domain-containing stress-associated protein 8 [Sesamum alatum]|uniref:Zinc finger A20 and AN1 domain-containing stress-associated protein 8 n=1 Tax=Sesamum alatum TaxID=300844 RepID=A0AAE2C9V9_9LAMI|nr:Zinc finger A20 and AN1 domain-containing stress-associated protein 8 [Sesamum alatum]